MDAECYRSRPGRGMVARHDEMMNVRGVRRLHGPSIIGFGTRMDWTILYSCVKHCPRAGTERPRPTSRLVRSEVPVPGNSGTRPSVLVTACRCEGGRGITARHPRGTPTAQHRWRRRSNPHAFAPQPTIPIRSPPGWPTATAACIRRRRSSRATESGVDRARKICATCPVTDTCLEYALEHRIEHGVWGGCSERERRRILKRRRLSLVVES